MISNATFDCTIRKPGNVADVSKCSLGGTLSNGIKMAVNLGVLKVETVLTHRYWKWKPTQKMARKQ
jgi:hypothetical protein